MSDFKSYNKPIEIQTQAKKAENDLAAAQAMLAESQRQLEKANRDSILVWFKLAGLGVLFFIPIYFIFFQDKGGGEHQLAQKQKPKFVIDTSPEEQAKRQRILLELRERGLVTDINKTKFSIETIVRPSFMVLDYKSKEAFIKVVYLYYYAQGIDLPVSLISSITNKEIGSYRAGYRLELD